MMHRLMLFGAAGQVGQEVLRQPLPAGCGSLHAYNQNEIDITRQDDVRQAIQTVRPDLVINAAGMTNVDGAEKDKQTAYAVNGEAPGSIAAICAENDIPMIHLSTDYVFRGDRDIPYRPDDALDPVNVYGRSKMMGEEAVRQATPKHVIIRLSSVFSIFGRNILTNTITLIEERDELKMVNDQVACPTPAASVAETLICMSEAILMGKKDGFGTYHYCGTPPCSRYEFTRAILKLCAPFTSRCPVITPVSSDIYAHLAPRPRRSVLDCGKIGRDYGILQPSWQEGFGETVRLIFQNRKLNS